MKIIRNQPATRWGEAFPLGNGHMGAMTYSSLPINRIDLSENTFFSGERSSVNNQADASVAFWKMREYAMEGSYDKVHAAAKDFIGIRNNYGTNLPVGALLIDYGVKEEEITSFERSLDIMSGLAVTTFQHEEYTYREELLISHPDKILIDHIQTDKKSNIHITFLPGNEYGEVRYENSIISFDCYAYEKLHCDQLCGVLLTGYGVVETDGRVSASPSGITVEGAKDIKLLLGMTTDFKRGFPTKAAASQTLRLELEKHIDSCRKIDYNKLRDIHIQDILSYMQRTMLKIKAQDEITLQIPLLFQYGRYLLLSSSRNDSKLPTHLQGIWNDNVACRIGWTCDMHLDINTQMNYWPAEVTNLAECAEPLYRWIRDDLAVQGAQTATVAYGYSGWVGELVSNAWGYAAPYWATPIAPCPTGGVWILMQLWEHYLFSRDLTFLADIAFPLLEDSVEFFQQYVFWDETAGYYTSGPSISPENSFLYQGKNYQISNGCTYEIIMIRELFEVYLQACDRLKNSNVVLQTKVQTMLSKLLPYRITEEGTIAEWNHDLPQADRQHRHTSHLLGLYPFSQIDYETTPELCEAAKKTIEERLTPINNWEDTGWARSMLILYETRLRNGQAAYDHIKSMLTHLLEPNCMVYHPPTRGAGAFDHVYELDGNTGLTTAVAELLLQSHRDRLHLLPALPKEWSCGEVKGLCARGNISVDMTWEQGVLQSATLTAKDNMTCQVIYANNSYVVHLEKDKPYQLSKEVQ